MMNQALNPLCRLSRFHNYVKNINFKILFRDTHVTPCIYNMDNRKYSGKNETKLIEYNNRLEIKIPRWPHSLHLSYIWLRDHCRCHECYNQKTFQRIKDVYEIPINIRPISLSHSDKNLDIEWPDGHRSIYDLKFLWQNSLEGKKTSNKMIEQNTWTKNSFPAMELISVPFHEFKEQKKGKMKLVEAILKYGIGFVTEVSPTVEATKETVEELCMVKRTFFGEMWSFQSDLEHADTAYSNEYLGPHTDTTYLTEASRIQVFHCLQVAKKGGETLVIDGFHIGEQLKMQDQQCYKFLSEMAFPCEYVGDNQHHMNLDVIFKHHPISKKLTQFRYNIYDRAPLSSISFNKMQDFYTHLQKLTALVRNRAYEVQFLLQPGQVLFIDNWRVMHGRTEYEGPRIMGGCYLDNNDFTSKARTLGFAV